MLSWVVIDCRYKLEEVGRSWKKQKIRKEELDMIQAPTSCPGAYG
jgi:hypothetical protein